METVKIEISLSKKREHIVINAYTFEDGLATETKTAIIKIDSENHDPEEILESAQAKSWKIVGEPDNQGFYKAVPVKAKA